MDTALFVAKGKTPIELRARMANRHGLIAGATGTGKTVTLRVLAEGLSRMGVPVFMADIKGDLAGLSAAGDSAKIKDRAAELGLATFQFKPYPVAFWDVLGEQGHPARATVSDMGPLLLGRLLDLNETQTGVLNIVFKIADDNGLLILDLKDLQSVLQHVGDNAKDFTTQYGNISTATIGAIQRGLLTLGEQGADKFFGEPALNIHDLMSRDNEGRGFINILAADKLMEHPRLYATFLLWLMAELFENLPECGDLERPKMVFFFDEAHLLFNEAPKALLEKIEQVVRLIRSKGVGVYFCTQNPLDVPDTVLGQLGNRFQHALRAFTPRDQKAVKAAAQTFRSDGSVDVEKVISELGVGEALISVLDDQGIPTNVERALVYPPQSRLGVISPDERKGIIQRSPVFGQYERVVDRESAYERLKVRAEEQQNNSTISSTTRAAEPRAPGRQRQGFVEAFVKSTVRTVGSQLGREILRGVMGSLLGGSRRSSRY
ncbi:MAG: DUF853 domain-containing protein [Oligoflexia bacterium]|nr:DUF853 domain-containing protein [Oligoflexia bacterium]